MNDAFRLVLAFDSTAAALQAARFVAAHQGAATQVLALIVPPGEALVGEAERELDAARSVLGEKAQYAVRAGYPPEIIVAEARDRAAHAIVAGTRARGGALGLGSVASEILRDSEFPLILVKHAARIPPTLGRSARVVLATDGSAPSLRAAALVPAWQEWLGELEAHVLHAHDPLRRESAREAEDMVRACAEALSGCGAVHTHVEPGDPASAIARRAADSQADLVFMGTHGRGARSHALFGSIAMKTVQWSPVPVVLVP